MLVRSWNVFHGNTVPPQRHAFLDEMLALATADGPDVLCLQELPAWALGRFTAGDVAARPAVGPLPVPRTVGRLLTAPDHGLLRSAFSGQGNAIELAARHRLLGRGRLVLNSLRFRREQARALHLGAVTRLAWAKERRIVQTVRFAASGGGSYLVANLHCTGSPDRRLPDAELLRAASFAVSSACPEDVVVLAGDFNVRPEDSRSLAELEGAEWGFSKPGPGIDHILVRGATASALRVWPAARRRRRGDALLSDHAPVELEVG